MSHLSDLFFSKLNSSCLYEGAACGRYAPSPTGPLHFGNLRTALIAWLQARLANGRFILRIEDIDLPRTRPGSAEQIIDDLKWLGLDWDEGPDIGGEYAPYTQSERFELYQAAIDYLSENNFLFPCFCSRKDIAQAASAPHVSDQLRIYPGTCRPANKQKREQPPPPDRQAALRFLCPEKHITFADQILGKQDYALHRDSGDFVVKRSDGLFSYHIAVVVDDALMGVSDVVRGCDLIDSTAQQILLMDTFGFALPSYWHIPLVLDASGKRLSKRDGSLSIDYYREKGIDSAHLVGQLAASLDLVPQGSRLSCQELVEECSLEQLRHCLQLHSQA